MSRVGKMSITVPQGVDVQITADQITVKGANGSIQLRAGEFGGLVSHAASPAFGRTTSSEYAPHSLGLLGATQPRFSPFRAT